MRKLDSCGLHLGLSFALKTFFFFLHEFFLSFCVCVCVCVFIFLKLILGTQKGVMTGMVPSPLTTGVGGLMTELRRILLTTRTLCVGQLPAPSVALCNQLQHFADGDGFT